MEVQRRYRGGTEEVQRRYRAGTWRYRGGTEQVQRRYRGGTEEVHGGTTGPGPPDALGLLILSKSERVEVSCRVSPPHSGPRFQSPGSLGGVSQPRCARQGERS